jgi:hypothetical protein
MTARKRKEEAEDEEQEAAEPAGDVGDALADGRSLTPEDLRMTVVQRGRVVRGPRLPRRRGR